jgi:hypothetical protein
MIECDERELWVMGLGDKKERGAIVCGYLAEGGFRCRTAEVSELASPCTPRAILLDLSPWSDDGWGILLNLKSNVETRDIAVLPMYLSEIGQVGEVFPIAGFFTLPIDQQYLGQKLRRLGLAEESEDYDLQAMLVTRRGEEQVMQVLTKLGFDVVNAYTGKEAVALGTIIHPYMIFCSLTLSDSGAFELMERFKLYPQTRNIPFFVLLRDIKDSDRVIMGRSIEHLVRKTWLTRQEFLAYFKKSG